MPKKYLAFPFVFLAAVSLPAQGTQFAEPVNVSKSRTRIDTLPAIAVDKNNKVHIAWNAFYAKAGAPDGVAGDIYYTDNVSGNFKAPARIRVAAGWYSRDPSMAVDSKGKAHIVFRRSHSQMHIEEDDDIYYVTNARGDFNHPLLLVDGKPLAQRGPTDVSGPYDPIIHCDIRDHLYLLFETSGFGKQYTWIDPLVYMNTAAGGWTKPSVVVHGSSIVDFHSCLDRNNFVHIAYCVWDAKGKWHVFYLNNRGGKFSKPIQASSSKHEGIFDSRVATDSQGKAHIVYRTSGNMDSRVRDIYYVNNVSGNFRSWKAVCDSSPYYLPSLAIDKSNVVHIAYKLFPSWGGHLYYGNNSSGDFKFTAYSGLASFWYPGSSYFALGTGASLHFAFYNWIGEVYDSDTEIYYLSGSWNK